MGLFVLTEEQKDFQALAHEFAEKEIRPISAEFDRAGEIPWDTLKKAADAGFFATGFPVEYGGLGLSYVTQSLIVEQMAWGDAGFNSCITASMLGSKPILLAGTEEQKRYAADIVLAGGLASFALTEPNAGSDSAAITTTAVKKADGYVINGRKCFITNGPYAQFYTVLAKTDPSQGARGISAFLVEREREGVSVGKHEDKMGVRLASASDVIFEDVFVPAKNLIGVENKGFKLAMQTLNMTRGTVAAGAVGVAQAALDHAVKNAKERITFGKPIGQHQGLQFMLADMEIQIQAARSLILHAAELVDAGQGSPSVTACAKAMASDTAMKVTTDAVQILGGYGYSREYPVEKLMRDAKLYQIFEGTNQIQRVVIGGALLK